MFIKRRMQAIAGILLCVTSMTAVAAVNSPLAHAATPKALILSDSVSSGVAPDGNSLEQYEAQQDGFAVTLVDGTQWDAMTAAQFAQYQAIIIGDPTCDYSGNSFLAAVNNESTWGPS